MFRELACHACKRGMNYVGIQFERCRRVEDNDSGWMLVSDENHLRFSKDWEELGGAAGLEACDGGFGFDCG